ncbi:hypothetical protein ALC53_04340 [Atta colombica]|uniref:Uncharacterized protein n=1 Tax=Atta colombica TaxID=520822 RepID=A0A151I4S7_9HYME|nr:hypothetical protein ALC53_04340 [Atta colombica]
MSRQRLGAFYCDKAEFSHPLPFRKRIMSIRPQEKRQEEPKVPFAKMRGCPSGFRSFVRLATFRRGIEEGAAQKRRRLRKPQA